MHRYRIFAFYREKTIREGRIFPEREDRGGNSSGQERKSLCGMSRFLKIKRTGIRREREKEEWGRGEKNWEKIGRKKREQSRVKGGKMRS